MSSEAPIKRRPRKAFDWSSATIAVAVVVGAVVVYWRDGQARFLEILFSDLTLFVDILPKVLAACLIAAFVAVLMPRVTEVSESDKVGGKRSDPAGVTPAEGQVVAAYKKVRAAALKRDLKGVLAAQGFDEKEIAAIRALPGIDADLAVYADRFLKPGTTGEIQTYPGYGAVTGEGVNSKKAKFINFYWFTPCEGRLVLTNIYENPQ